MLSRVQVDVEGSMIIVSHSWSYFAGFEAIPLPLVPTSNTKRSWHLHIATNESCPLISGSALIGRGPLYA